MFDSSYKRGKPLTFRVGVGEVNKSNRASALSGRRDKIRPFTLQDMQVTGVSLFKVSENWCSVVCTLQVIKGWDQGIVGGEGIPPMLAGSSTELEKN